MYELFTEYTHDASGAQLTQSVFVETKIELISALPPTHQTFQSDDHIHVAPHLCFSKRGAGP